MQFQLPPVSGNKLWTVCLFVAVKAGGMRIVQKHQSVNDVPDKKNDKDSKEYETEM